MELLLTTALGLRQAVNQRDPKFYYAGSKIYHFSPSWTNCVDKSTTPCQLREERCTTHILGSVFEGNASQERARSGVKGSRATKGGSAELPEIAAQS